MRSFLLLLAAGAAGTAARYGLTLWTQRWLYQRWGAVHWAEFPWATMGINVLGTFVLAYVTTLALNGRVSPETRLLLGTGFCGAFTTFSTFEVETEAWLRRAPALASVYILGNLLLGFGAVLLARAVPARWAAPQT